MISPRHFTMVSSVRPVFPI